MHESQRQAAYGGRIKEVEHRSFTLGHLVSRCYDQKTARIFEYLAKKLVTGHGQPYSLIFGTVLAFSLLSDSVLMVCSGR